MKIYVSTGALIGRPNGRDYRLLKDFKNQLNCDGFEFMLYSDWYGKTDEIADFLKTENIKTPTFHCQKSVTEAFCKGAKEEFADAYRRFEENAKLAQKIGATKLIVHLWNGLPSDQKFENNIECYKKLREISEANGVDLLVENVVCNCKDPFSRWIELHEVYPDIHFIFDTKMADFHRQLEKLYDKDMNWLFSENLIRHYHVNDYGGGYMDWANMNVLPIGAGHIDFERFFTFIKSKGYDDTITLESTAFDSTGIVNFDMLNKEIEYVRNLK